MAYRLLDWFLPAVRPTGEEDIFRFRFVAVVTWLAVLVALSIILAAMSALPYTAICSAACGLLMAGVGLAMKLGLPVGVAFWIDAALFTLLLVAIPLGETHLDWALVAWVGTLPLAGALFGRVRGGLVGLALALAAIVGVLATRDLDLVPREHPPELVTVFRTAIFCVAIGVLATVFERLRADATRRAYEAARARTFFLANMSHEIRTPMNGVIGLADLLLAEGAPPDARRTLELIRRSGEQLVGIINDIVDFSRLDSGRVTVNPQPTRLRDIVADCVELGRALAPRDEVALRAEVAADVPEWLALDPLRMRQILMNLVGNAAKFTPKGEVVVRVTRDAASLTIAVADTGIGIPADAVARIFLPFEQVASPTQRLGGSGLGLAITRHLVELMGGHIAVESEPGRGSTFTVSVPLHEASSPLPAEPIVDPVAELPPSREVLVVDDNEVNRFVASATVKRLGYEPRVATNGREAVELASAQRFAFILMDCYMPELDGFEATRRIRALPPPASTTPILALTASVMTEEREQCLTAGMDGFVAKPLALDELRAALPAALALGAQRAARASAPHARPAQAH